MRHGTAQGSSGGKTQPSTIPVAGIQTCRLQPWLPWILHSSSCPWLCQEMAARPACLTRLGAPHWIPVPAQSCCTMPCATVLLAVWHSPAAAGRGTCLGWVQCSLSHPGTPGSLCAPQLGGPYPPPPIPSVPDLGVSQPQGPSVPALALFIDRAGGCWASTPPHSPSLARLSGCITSPSATHTPPALALPLPRVSLLSPLPPHRA